MGKDHMVNSRIVLDSLVVVKISMDYYVNIYSAYQAEAETGAFELIMRDKERLLSLDEPLSFIFSHSALREGWDNPNVFQICTLAESTFSIKKRQEIGRGLRLAVNQLTIIANESYEDFARALQSEFNEAGVRFNDKLVKNEKDKVKVRLKKGYQLDPLFVELWKKISARTRYEVQYSSDKLIKQAALAIKDGMPRIERPRIALSRADIKVTDEGVQAIQTGLTSSTLAKILLQSERLDEALNNPQLFIDYCAQHINAKKSDFLIYGDGTSSGVQYFKLAADNQDTYYAMQLFEEKHVTHAFQDEVHAVIQQNKTLFSHIVIDSATEQAFAKSCENNDNIEFYIKLPNWFKIDTPVGTYNPDWALIWKDDERLYFVAETKNTGTQRVDTHVLRPLEQWHIECGKRHFAEFEQVTFKAVQQLTDLRE